MRAIIPVAGNGLRLRPITNTKPKALIEVAGKPVLEHIIMNMCDSDINEIVLIVGHMKQSIINWMNDMYQDRFNLHFIQQKEKLGLGHAIFCANEFLDETEVLITLGDEIFAKPYSSMIEEFRNVNNSTCAVGIKEVDDPNHYGMIRLDENNIVTEMLEKPSSFDGRLALAGVYYFKKGVDLLSSIGEIMNRHYNEVEYQLTDALQLMIERGTRFSTINVGKWYDCGRIDKIMSSNQQLLENNHFIHESSTIVDSKIIEPCFIGKDSRISNSTVGPYVSVGANVSIDNCEFENAIIESNTAIFGIKLKNGIYSKNERLLAEY